MGGGKNKKKNKGGGGGKANKPKEAAPDDSMYPPESVDDCMTEDMEDLEINSEESGSREGSQTNVVPTPPEPSEQKVGGAEPIDQVCVSVSDQLPLSH